jgi:hypothetical protein
VETPLRIPLDQAAVRARLVRQWMLCGKDSLFGGAGEAGLEIAEDGRWYLLDAQPDGAISRRLGATDSGTWELQDTSFMNGPGVFQLNFLATGRMWASNPAFADGPHKLRLNDSMQPGTYVAAGEPPPAAVPAVEEAAAFPSLACASPGPVATIDLTEGVKGRWLACGASVLETNEIGLDLDADGHWCKLYPGSTPGTVVRARGFDREGLRSFVSAQQLNLKIAGGPTALVFPVLTSEPRTMRFNGMSTLLYGRVK